MNVRPAVPADAPLIHEVSKAACRAAYAEPLEDHALLETVEDPARVQGIRDRLAEAAGDDRLIYLVAEDDGLLGFAQLLAGGRTPEHVDAGDAYLRSLYVRPDRWREGIGSDLLAAACARLPASTRRVLVGVLAVNDLGRRFYERRGFEQVDTGTFEARGTTYETAIYARDHDTDG